MIDKDGYRSSVGIVVANHNNKVLLTKRIGENAWQFPQGGIKHGENDLDALFRELYEEVGLSKKDVKLTAKTPKWLSYDLPNKYIRKNQDHICIGQKQVWYLLSLVAKDSSINLNLHKNIEFDDWQWVDYWSPIDNIIGFKKNIYEDVLKILAPVFFDNKYKIPQQYNRPIKYSAIILRPLHKHE